LAVRLPVTLKFMWSHNNYLNKIDFYINLSDNITDGTVFYLFNDIFHCHPKSYWGCTCCSDFQQNVFQASLNVWGDAFFPSLINFHHPIDSARNCLLSSSKHLYFLRFSGLSSLGFVFYLPNRLLHLFNHRFYNRKCFYLVVINSLRIN